jgi:hypothetical protein
MDEVPPHNVRIDEIGTDATRRKLHEWSERGEWEQIADYLEGCRGYWDYRTSYISGLATRAHAAAWIDTWVRRRPSCAAFCCRGVARIITAWEIRGSGRANTVERDAWPRFFEMLGLADADLARARDLDPHDPAPWSLSITSAMGLEFSVEEREARFRHAVARNPRDIDAHARYLKAICRKWGGSEELMFQLARETASGLPEGHSLHTLICRAHIEGWMDLSVRPRAGLAQKDYFCQPHVVKEVNWAADRYIRTPHAQHALTLHSDRNDFAFCFRLMRDPVALLEQMDVIGDLISEYPWAYQRGRAEDNYARDRAWARRQLRAAA